MAKVIVEFDGVPDGRIHPKRFLVGDDVAGALASVAVSSGWASVEDASTPAKSAPQLDAKKAVAVAGKAVAAAKAALKKADDDDQKAVAQEGLAVAEADLAAAKLALEALG